VKRTPSKRTTPSLVPSPEVAVAGLDERRDGVDREVPSATVQCSPTYVADGTTA
jgi:hypothetical protein